jgi:hypothetical protein
MVRRRTRDQVGESAHPMDLLYPKPRVFEQIDEAVFVEFGAGEPPGPSHRPER